MSDTYADFVATKMRPHIPCGIHIAAGRLHERLFDFQRVIVAWALRMGRCAVFADCGLGKTGMQLEWAQQVHLHTGGSVLVFAPLTVAGQTVREGAEQAVAVTQVRFGEQIRDGAPGVYITNYDRFEHFQDLELAGVVLDESSILKNQDGKTRTALIKQYAGVPFRLACTATPAPNDHAELANHAEFLGIKTRVEMLATFFVHDADGWRLKRHAEGEFYRWLASWAVCLRKPSDIGFSDEGYQFPPLEVRQCLVACDKPPEGFLFAGLAGGVVGRAQLRRSTLEARVEAAAQLVEAEPDESWILWTGLNDESEALERRLKHLPGLVRVEGAHSEYEKTEALRAFASGAARYLITKPKICGFGMNFQHSARQAFVGIGDSYEAYYQALRRSWRFGQTRAVVAHIVVSEAEDAIVRNVLRKEEEAKMMGDQVIACMSELEKAALAEQPQAGLPPGVLAERTGQDWRLIHGDCVESLREKVKPESVHLSVFSPPFADLYTYSDNPRDMGNSRGADEFFRHFVWLTEELLRATVPGRLACVHVAQVPTQLARDGVIGLTDFRGRVISTFQAAGWVYHREVCIDKDPQAQAIRTHSKALMFVQLKKDRSWIGPALADYILVFRAPGDNPVPIKGGIDNESWIQWARPIWYGIKETHTLNAAEGRGDRDERHICPLQLGVIERCVRLWSNPGELVLSPFAGIGSEGYQSLLCDRRFVGVELKSEYFQAACRNLRRAEQQRGEQNLFAEAQ